MTAPVATGAPAAAVPSARQLRARIRRLRKQRHTGSLTEALTDAYVVALMVAAFGWAAIDNLRLLLDAPEVRQTDAGERYWIAAAATLAAAGLVWQGLRAIGPLLVTPAMQSWVVSAPVDRRSWLLPRFGALVLGAAGGTALLALAVTAGAGGGGYGWSALAGATCGAAGVALSVIAQSARREPRWARFAGPALVGTGAAIVLAVIAAHFTGAGVPWPWLPLVAAAGLLALPVAVPATAYAIRRLSMVERSALTTGAQFANAAATAAVLLDPSMFTGLIESRRWRSVGRVRSRPFRPGSRFRVLLRAELRRPLRHPSAVTVWAAMALGLYAVAIALPSIEGAAHVILAYLATDRLTGGLRALSRSPGLRRSLGGDDTTLKLAHLVVPAAGAVIWYLVTLPAVRPGLGWIDLLLVPGVVAAAYRAGSRPPTEFGGVVVDTPFGMIPVDLVRQLIRGPDLVIVLVIAQMLWA